ncbi:hypothetical protein APS14_20910 [Pseudomonas thivervalensis]|nr:hypothetical protein APS14_20910 [Pseudomonas thivervalensis]
MPDVQREVEAFFQRSGQQRFGEGFDRLEPGEQLFQFSMGLPTGLHGAFQVIPIRRAGLG